MRRSKKFAQRIYNKLKPNEEDFMRVQDVCLFYNQKKSIIIYVALNLVFILLALLNLSAYSYLFLFLGLYFASPFYLGVVKPVLRKLILSEKVEDIQDPNRQSYTVQEFSAFCGTVRYQIGAQLVNARSGIENKSAFLMFGTMFALNFFFFLFLSIPDWLSLLLLFNLILFLPLILQKSFTQQFSTIKERGVQIILDMAGVQEEEKNEKVDEEPLEKVEEVKEKLE